MECLQSRGARLRVYISGNYIELRLVSQGLINLVGLTIAAPRPRGGFSYTHPPTGFIFEIVNDDSDSEDEAGSLVFNPLSFGTAEEVTHLPISLFDPYHSFV